MAITYTKLRSGEWGIKGPAGELPEGKEVVVSKRDGSVRTETVRTVYWTDGQTSIASVVNATRARGKRRPAVKALSPRMAAVKAQSTQPGGVALTAIIDAQRADRADAQWAAARAEQRAQDAERESLRAASGSFAALIRAKLGA